MKEAGVLFVFDQCACSSLPLCRQLPHSGHFPPPACTSHFHNVLSFTSAHLPLQVAVPPRRRPHSAGPQHASRATSSAPPPSQALPRSPAATALPFSSNRSHCHNRPASFYQPPRTPPGFARPNSALISTYHDSLAAFAGEGLSIYRPCNPNTLMSNVFLPISALI